MSKTAIKVENLSKQYRLGQVGTGTLSHDLNRWWHRVRGKEDPYLKIGETNDRTSKGQSEYVWALQDINFEVKEGEVLGIIGKNGAGKSTLLKILSKVTGPTTGSIKAKGRIASLLEVGTGFHPELTGRENIYLNGTILGMTKAEVKAKLDEIVAFAGVERYLDTPVKRYSSGMMVRLGFAVAAHLEPEILVVDEVLAVGDLEFQEKAIGKMQEVNQKGGRTVLFVSHNMASIRTLCENGIVLKDGYVDFTGTSSDAVEHYTQLNSHVESESTVVSIPDDATIPAQILSAYVKDKHGQVRGEFDCFDEIFIEFQYQIRKSLKGLALNVVCNRLNDVLFLTFDTDESPEALHHREPGTYKARFQLPYPLKAGVYTLKFGFGILMQGGIHNPQEQLVFKVVEKSFNPTTKSLATKRVGVMATSIRWQTRLVE